jgi:hypothetical protein
VGGGAPIAGVERTSGVEVVTGLGDRGGIEIVEYQGPGPSDEIEIVEYQTSTVRRGRSSASEAGIRQSRFGDTPVEPGIPQSRCSLTTDPPSPTPVRRYAPPSQQESAPKSDPFARTMHVPDFLIVHPAGPRPETARSGHPRVPGRWICLPGSPSFMFGG